MDYLNILLSILLLSKKTGGFGSVNETIQVATQGLFSPSSLISHIFLEMSRKKMTPPYSLLNFSGRGLYLPVNCAITKPYRSMTI